MPLPDLLACCVLPVASKKNERTQGQRAARLGPAKRHDNDRGEGEVTRVGGVWCDVCVCVSREERRGEGSLGKVR